MRGQFTKVKIDETSVSTTVGQEIELGELEVGTTIRADMEVVIEPGEKFSGRLVSALDAQGLSWSAGRRIKSMSPTVLKQLEDLGLVTYDKDGKRWAHTPIVADGKSSNIGTDYQKVALADGEQYLRPKMKEGSGGDVGENVTSDAFAIEFESEV